MITIIQLIKFYNYPEGAFGASVFKIPFIRAK